MERFQWVKCQLDNVAACPTDRAKRKALSELPPTLDATYQRILEKVGLLSEETQIMVKKALQCLVTAKRPLTVAEVVDAVSVTVGGDSLDKEGMIMEDDLIEWCGSLVRI